MGLVSWDNRAKCIDVACYFINLVESLLGFQHVVQNELQFEIHEDALLMHLASHLEIHLAACFRLAVLARQTNKACVIKHQFFEQIYNIN